ncbi:MAG TPA: S-adenosylmethionine:tRNA ribosyltransferase-isomerase [Catalimonadaceae bacterium]|nr:S-adenosylmethionine:tRNA ribosyltransferase-isomerase [Catalimonadaceae bacterium]
MSDQDLPDFLHTLQTTEFDYPLPEESIALYPLEERDLSKLLVFRNGQISHAGFREIPDFLPEKSLMVFNNTKVIPARLHFQRETGSWIEILIVAHHLEKSEDGVVMNCQCIIGNKKKWKPDEILYIRHYENGTELVLQASWRSRDEDQVSIRWNPQNLSFAEVLAHFGEMPIPPYLNREADETDKTNYQTVYAKEDGAIAAPTAGLHFTDRVLKSLADKGLSTTWLTLHVGLGTFRPMKSEKVAEHEMHPEEVVISKQAILDFLQNEGPVITVGTTSIRSLESLFWLGTELLANGSLPQLLETKDPYQWSYRKFTPHEVWSGLLNWLETNKKNEIRFFTRLYIMPGYTFRVVNGLVTNFHQPKSTLLVLISAFIGPGWKEMYSEALRKNYRFLSYGDSSLLFPRG